MNQQRNSPPALRLEGRDVKDFYILERDLVSAEPAEYWRKHILPTPKNICKADAILG